MKKLSLILLLIVGSNALRSQKLGLNYSAYSNWPEINVDNIRISNNGNYIIYSVGSDRSGTKVFIQSTNGVLKKQIDSARDTAFTEDSRRVTYIDKKNTLAILDLDTDSTLYFTDVKNYKGPIDGSGRWLSWQLISGELVLYDFVSKIKRSFPKTVNYLFGRNGKVIVFQTDSTTNANRQTGLQWLDLEGGRIRTIWRGSELGQIALDESEKQLAFISKDDRAVSAIYYYHDGMDSAKLWVDTSTKGVGTSFMISNDDLKFSSDGKRLFFTIYEGRATPELKPPAVKVDIWSYQDYYLQSEQLDRLLFDQTFKIQTVINLGENVVIRLNEYQKSKWRGVELNDGDSDEFALYTSLSKAVGYHGIIESFDVYLVKTKDGSRKCIKERLLNATPSFSPGGKYVFWFDLEKKAYFSYEIRSGITRDISTRVPAVLCDEENDEAAPSPSYSLGPWLKNDEAFLIYDKYDIWKVDPLSIKLPTNITKGYGRKNKVCLRYVFPKERWNLNVLFSDDTIFLCGLNEINKNNGFYRVKIDFPNDPIPLSMGPEFVYFYGDADVFSNFILKAKRANIYVVKRMRASEYPNLEITGDFRKFTRITFLQPQAAYNWMTSELLRWKTFDGKPGEGILYKPEDFDVKKKYPIIFYFYERLADGLNKFLKPELSQGPLSIPWYVSNGYLVFCPDIRYKIGEPGESAYNYVVSAATMMRDKPWVDGKHMAIQGHSWGGYEVNYLITRTKMFAAAASAAGPVDFVSLCGILGFYSGDAHGFTELGQNRLGLSLWENPSAYLKNSPILAADKVSTPLMFMHNKNDDSVPWTQGVEWFTALRRLGKKVWMLQYDDGNHTIYEENALDYEIRLSQFFGHYLKGIPAPKWMLEGVPAMQKGVDTGWKLLDKMQ